MTDTSTTVPGTTVTAALQVARSRVEAACREAGRNPDEVRLLAVSKTHPLPMLVEAVRAGCAELAESRVQEIVEKSTAWPSDVAAEPDWVLIGHLQRNKVRDVVAHVGELQTLDSLALAEALDRRLQAAGRAMRVLVQVNSSGEETKSGLAPDQVLDFCRALAPFSSLQVEGLMTIARRSENPDEVSACFETMRTLQGQLRDEGTLGSSWRELSMGMSGDLELAIAHGATTVRIGTAIFGLRSATA